MTRSYTILKPDEIPPIEGINPIPYSSAFQAACHSRYATRSFMIGVRSEGKLELVLPAFVHVAGGIPTVEIPHASYYAEIFSANPKSPIDLYELQSGVAKLLGADVVRWNIVDYHGRIHGSYPSTFFSLVLPLSSYQSADDLLQRKVHLRRRNQIKVAQRQGFSVRMIDPQRLDAFYTLYQTHHRQRQYRVRSREEFANIIRAYGDQAHILGVYQGDRLAAAQLFLVQNGYLWMAIHASDYAYRDYQVNAFAYWEVIRWAFDHEVKWVDFGGTPSTDAGNLQFKQGFGVDRYPIYAPVYFRGPIVYIRYWLQRKWWHATMRWRILKDRI